MRPRSSLRSLVLALLAVALLASACSGGDGDAASTDDDGGSGAGSPAARAIADPEAADMGFVGTAAEPLDVTLGNASAAAPEGPVPNRTVEGSPLGEDSLADLLGRLPDLADDVADRLEFNRPTETQDPPRIGDTIDVPFPGEGDDDAPEVDDGPLEVLRHQPDGDVAIAPSLNLTFNQPMVPVATLAQLDAEDPPVLVSPPVEGRWQWIGTRTLRFEATSDEIDRLSASTTFEVTVPAGTESATGGTLAEAYSFSFTTPTVDVTSLVPSGESVATDAVFVATFNQRIDPEAVLESVSFSVDGDDVAVRLATDEELADDEAAQRSADAAAEGRWIAFRPSEELPTNAALDISFGEGLRSAEGPNRTATAQDFDARTYGPLEVTGDSCRTSAAGCKPTGWLWIEFSNPLDTAAFEPDWVSIQPEPAGFQVGASGGLELRGDFQGRTDYIVTLESDLVDVFGQTLGESAQVTLEIGEADPSLSWRGQQIATLDPLAGRRTIEVTTVNHHELEITVYAAEAAGWPDYLTQSDRGDGTGAPTGLDVVENFRVQVDGEDDRRTVTEIDLEPYFDGDFGHRVVRIEPTGELADLSRNDDLYWQNRPVNVWAQSTHLATDAHLDGGTEVLTWTTDLTSGDPVEGASLTLLTNDATADSDTEGLARIDLPSRLQGEDWREPLLTTLGDDTAITPEASWTSESRSDGSAWYVVDDRGLYRPGESVRAKGWIRSHLTSTDSSVELVNEGTEIEWTAAGPFGNELATGEVEVSPLGGFDVEFEIPEGTNLGTASIHFAVTRGATFLQSTSHSFRIEEFRRPEFEVTAEVETPAPHVTPDPVTVVAEAAYLAGGGLADTPVDWVVQTASATFRPPGWDRFEFGIWQPWWIDDSFSRGFEPAMAGGPGFAGDVDMSFEPGFPNPFDPEGTETFTGITDADGRHALKVDFEGDGDGQPTSVNAAATVMDANRQAFSSSASFLVHPSDVYVGQRSEQTFVKEGDPIEVELIAVDLDGEAVAGRPISVTASRLEERFVDGEWTTEEVDTQSCDITSEDAAVRCTFEPEQGGRHRITATVTDEAGRTQRSELTRWVSGGDERPTRNIEQGTITLVPDAEDYAPGDTAELLVETPFAPAQGLLIIEHNGIESTELIDITEPGQVVEVPIAEAHIPNVGVRLELTGVTARVDAEGEPLAGAPPRPAYAVGRIDLPVSAEGRRLSIEVTPEADEIEPGASTSMTVEVTDADGNPVEGAEMVVSMVDEAVLALTGYEFADPLAALTPRTWTNAWSIHARRLVLLSDPLDADGNKITSTTVAAALDEMAEQDGAMEFSTAAGDDADMDAAYVARSAAPAPAPMALGGGVGETAPAIDTRTTFDALAVWAPEVVTDAAGLATIEVDLPDNLTRYRIMVAAVDGANHAGLGEADVTARLPLMVRPSPPRFLNFGDTIEFPVLVQNQTDEDLEVELAIRTTNLELVDADTKGAGSDGKGSEQATGRTVTVPANDRVEVRFPATTDQVGTARFQVVAASGSLSDAADGELPVYTPATAEAFATYGTLDGGALAQPVLAPEGVEPSVGGLEISTSSTAVQALTDAMIYLTDYPYDSTDGLASRILGITTLRDVLEAFEAEGLPSPADIEAQVNRDVERLIGLQNPDGGFPAWERGRPSDPFRSIQATHAMSEARREGYDVPGATLLTALGRLEQIEDLFDPEWSQDTKDSLSAYALFVRTRAGDRDPVKAAALYERAGEDLQLDALAWVWTALDDGDADAEIQRRFENLAVDTAAGASFTTSYGDDSNVILHSDRRTDGVVLGALIEKAPESDLVPKVVAGLLSNRRKDGRWGNVQENAFILQSMKDYFDTFEAATPDFVARLWYGDVYAGEHVFEGRSVDRSSSIVTTAELVAEGDADLVIGHEGSGRLYYRIGLDYTPDDLSLDPLDRGFEVARSYEPVDDPDDVRRTDDGWEITAGARVRVRLTMVADSRRTDVALVDSLPAGLEPLNPTLATTEPLPIDPALLEEFEMVVNDMGLRPGMPEYDDMAREFGVKDIVMPGPGPSWWEHENLRDDRAEAVTQYLGAGVHEWSFVTRATTPGEFVVPPAKAEEIYTPETFGRSGTDSVVILDR